MNIIETTGLTKYYGKTRGIENLNLSVAEGELFGFIGPNGAGKSTTLRTLLGLIFSDKGSARLFGQPIGENRTALLTRIGFMPGEAVFYPTLRVKEILTLSARLRGLDCRAEAARLCERLALDAERKVGELSLGNRKKVSIVCALQHKPELYLLDEPTGGLDPLVQHTFFALLKERRDAGATVFLSSHILTEIQRHCTRAAIIRGGRIVACDTIEALTHTHAKRVTVHGAPDLTGLQQIRDLAAVGDGMSFLYSGALQPLLQRLSAAQLTDLTITEPELDEIFLQYYDTEEAAQ